MTKTPLACSFYQYRYYDPLTGRWPSRDPINDVGGATYFEKITQLRELENEFQISMLRIKSNYNPLSILIVSEFENEMKLELQMIRNLIDVGDFVGGHPKCTT